MTLVPIEAVSGMRLAAVVDVGGTTIKGAVARGDDVAKRLRRPTPVAAGPDAVVAEILAVVDELITFEPSVQAVGLAVPGIVDEELGIARWSENLGWRDVPLRGLVEQRTGLSIWIGHDVRAGGIAEFRCGSAAGADDAVFLPLGTGIAAALLFGGRIHSAEGAAGEIGHVDVGHGEPCRCGGHGCLEAIASAGAIARRYTSRTGRTVEGARDVVERMKDGDRDARAVWDAALEGLALGLSWLASVLAPEVIVLGGGLALAGDVLLDPLTVRLEERLTFQRRPRLVTAAYGDEAACVGAAILASEKASRGHLHEETR